MSQTVSERFQLKTYRLQEKWDGDDPTLPFSLDGFTDFQKKVWFNTAVGVEIEVENVGQLGVWGWECKLDGSLRNKGYEFVTEYGCRVHQIEHKLVHLHKTLKSYYPGRSYSERTSVHVHIDVRRFDERQLSNFLILYALLEDSLFRLCLPHRKENIFCVPTRESMQHIQTNLWKYVGNANKYTALNVICLGQFGTVEFRHHHGTDDPKTLTQWVYLLALIKMVAQTIDHDFLKGLVSGLKQSSQYSTFLRTLFKSWGALLESSSNFDLAVSDSKFFFNLTKDLECAD